MVDHEAGTIEWKSLERDAGQVAIWCDDQTPSLSDLMENGIDHLASEKAPRRRVKLVGGSFAHLGIPQVSQARPQGGAEWIALDLRGRPLTGHTCVGIRLVGSKSKS